MLVQLARDLAEAVPSGPAIVDERDDPTLGVVLPVAECTALLFAGPLGRPHAAGPRPDRCSIDIVIRMRFRKRGDRVAATAGVGGHHACAASGDQLGDGRGVRFARWETIESGDKQHVARSQAADRGEQRRALQDWRRRIDAYVRVAGRELEVVTDGDSRDGGLLDLQADVLRPLLVHADALIRDGSCHERLTVPIGVHDQAAPALSPVRPKQRSQKSKRMPKRTTRGSRMPVTS
jgi:hypothetical protein